MEPYVKAQYKTISKGTKDDESPTDSIALLNLCGYPEEEISHQTEKQEEEKEAINVPKVQEEKEETILTGRKRNAETIEGRKEQTKGEIINIIKEKEAIVEIDDKDSSFTSPLSIAVENGHFDIVKHILENTTDFDISDTGKSPLFLAVENGYYDILVLLLHSKYNDITKTYLDTTPLEIAVWRNKMKCVQLLVQDENKLQKYLGNYHLFNILVDLKRSEFCINEQTGKEDCQTQDRNHRHLPYPLWHIINERSNDYLTHLIKIGLDINKCDYNGNTLLYKILNTPGLKTYYIFSSLINFEVVNVGKTKWISLLETKREQMLQIGKYKYLIHLYSNTWFELRKHIRRNSI